MSKRPNYPRKPPTTSVCGFQVWDSKKKEMRPCGKASYVKITTDPESDVPQSFCKEHYVDAIMQLEGQNPDFELPLELEKLIEVKEQ